ncbi:MULTISPECIES: hypothetical protein [Microbacterium]|uniref:hypothetical protein n=1 Tax=Microbacterium TaxID=33882 RepID=UPI00217E2833|nr:MULTISPECIES: hypothetical protein [Microbacterium]UWF77625.1 hypothetical protein JSY13_00585 [Microbacterium neungamense]WCM55795.1 hypothetical protein JRG78_00600 [Microbacterium sp. EF45047]
MSAFVLKLAIVLVVLALIALLVWNGRTHPNRAKDFPDRIRMPRLVAVIGWLLVAVGILMGLAAFTAGDASEAVDDRGLLPMRIAAVAILAGGVLLVLLYRNWYVAPDADAVRFRTLLGREKRIAYADIVEYRMRTMGGRPNLRIRSVDGTRLTLNPAMFDMSPLFAAMEFRERTGRWPVPGEPR